MGELCIMPYKEETVPHCARYTFILKAILQIYSQIFHYAVFL